MGRLKIIFPFYFTTLFQFFSVLNFYFAQILGLDVMKKHRMIVDVDVGKFQGRNG